jgi:hypothetical protein
MVPKDCRRFETCSAVLCPLDPLWGTAAHLPGEQVCPYLLGSGKEGAGEWYGDDPVFLACVAQLPEIAAKHPDIARAVARAAGHPFRGRNLRERQPPGTEEGLALGTARGAARKGIQGHLEAPS